MILQSDPVDPQPARDIYGDIAIFTALMLVREKLQHLATLADYVSAGGTQTERDREILRDVTSVLNFVAREVTP